MLVEFHFTAAWLENAAPEPLTAIYYVNDKNLQIAVTNQPLAAESAAPGEQFARWLVRHRLVAFDPARPLQLAPVHIDKPWGRELWYTGVERRGVCDFVRGDARTPIPWLQAVTPPEMLGTLARPLVLLKILDPHPEPGRGDLYFELHESKRELYVVSHVDRRAWPDGVGYIRFGFDPALVASYADDREFRADYLAAVREYEAQRRELDELQECGVAPDASQVAREQLLAQRMHRFTHMYPLREGDIVEVPLLLPHALQHGVRVVEFQTPSYERKILSFGQKVLTQTHWDTADVVAKMQLVARRERPRGGDQVDHGGVVVERIAEFPDFEVFRAAFEPGARWHLQSLASYNLIMIQAGTLELAGESYGHEQAVLLPRFWRGTLTASEPAPPLVLLLSRPRS